MQKLKNKIICLVGESGSGKTTLYDRLREESYEVIDSYTTRSPRTPDELGHTFVTKGEFDAIRGDLAAYTKFDKYEYGTTFEQLKNSHFYIIDPTGVDDLSIKIGRGNFIVVYVYCSEKTRLERMKTERGENHACQRIYHDRTKFRDFVGNADWDYVIHNEFKRQLETNFYFLTRLLRKINPEV